MFKILKKKLEKIVGLISEKIEKKKPEDVTEVRKKKVTKKEIEEIERIKPAITEKVRPEIIKKIPSEREIEKKLAEPKGIVKKIVGKLVKKVSEKRISEEDLKPILENLEVDLIEADVAYEVVEKIKLDLMNNLINKPIRRGKEKEYVLNVIKQSLLEILSVPAINCEEIIKKAKKENRPALFLFLGFNGTGKSLSLAKLGFWLKNKGYKVLVAAGDTFRAAAIHQLEEYSKKAGLQVIKQSLLEILSVPAINCEEIIKKAKKENRPALFLFLGFNGTGKSLSLAKLGFWLKNKGYKVLVAAGDTFRAAAIHQLEEYSKKAGLQVIKQSYGADPCAVIFDARKAAEARNYDVVLADTAGRSHTDKNLMEELSKIVRVNKPDLKILVLDSLTGSDVINQFEFFDKAVGVDAIIFSKVDVNEKGGNILSVCYNFKKPILFLGNGQNLNNLIEYNPNLLISSLLT